MKIYANLYTKFAQTKITKILVSEQKKIHNLNKNNNKCKQYNQKKSNTMHAY